MEYLHDNAHTRRPKLLDLLHFCLQIAEPLIGSIPSTRKHATTFYKVEDILADVPPESKARVRRPCSGPNTSF
ncbi:hypothetical protein HPB50_017706 [Hyalomma asiaticum]|uniref:Uncharacterized protein n=1 Tax=Hyalomma asiaticum TaxID=266040 RepID=A0ACB7SGP6_HYAAI|nr:hypothetical protein HPB50_017706 [Hyalomma asiaticum]